MDRLSTILSLLLIFVLLASAISGCIDKKAFSSNLDSAGNNKLPAQILADNKNQNANSAKSIDEIDANGKITSPQKYALEPYGVPGNAICLTDEKDYEGIPILVPIFKNHDKMTSLAWKDASDGFKKNKLIYTDIDFENVSEFSSIIAITFYEKNEKSDVIKAIVVDSYENSILAGPIASILDIPILRYGQTTNEALWRIGAKNAENIIAIGNVPYSKTAGVSLGMQQDIWNFTVSLAKSHSVDMNYIVVCNPDDNDGLQSYFPQSTSTPYTAHLSCLASTFAAFRNGIVISVANGSVAPSPAHIDSSVENMVYMLNHNELKMRFLLLVGDSISLPFSYYFGNIIAAPVQDEEKIATDNIYADLEGAPENGYDTENKNGNYDYPEKAISVELAVGRIIAKNCSRLSMQLDRIVNYREYLAVESAPVASTMNTLSDEWNNNALAYTAESTESGWPEELQGALLISQRGFFNLKERSLDEKTLCILADSSLPNDFAISNFVFAGPDHGNPQRNSASYDRIISMPPNVNFQLSCHTGRIDNYAAGTLFKVSKSDSFAYSMIDNGCICYVASTRTMHWQFTGSYPMFDMPLGSAGDLAYYFFDSLIGTNCTVGEALQTAKQKADWDTSFEYVLYGDPAFNPYEPCNEGTK
ncbi:MAG: C25 family cysteine peptidase [Candidatus Thermoplasmatota archaeon]|nr:C25 family cysteine peptidase [Candidatus Thermoplasmatota archaeon]